MSWKIPSNQGNSLFPRTGSDPVSVSAVTESSVFSQKAARNPFDAAHGRVVQIELAAAGSGAAILSGTPDDDTLAGSEGGELILGFGGEDHLSGATGDDIVSGGVGDDALWALRGDDTIYGDTGNDFLFGNGGDDVLGGDATTESTVPTPVYGNGMLFDGGGDDLLRGDVQAEIWHDTAGFFGLSEDYAVETVDSTVGIIDLATGDIDTAAGIETLRFDDVEIDVPVVV